MSRQELVERYGADPIAYSTLQPGLLYLDTSFGYLAYQRVAGVAITLGPPVCAPDDRRELVSRFLRAQRRPVFCYVQADCARLLGGLAPELKLAGMGVDRLLALPSGEGRAAVKVLRGARKHAGRAGFSVERTQLAKLPAAMRGRLEAITAAYLSHSQLPYEMRFLNRPLCLTADDGLARSYLLRQRDRIFGYAVLNPWFAAGRVAGYLLDILRCEPTRQWGVYYAFVDHLAGELEQEAGADPPPLLSLGFCPLYKATAPADGLRQAPLLSAQVGVLERYLAAVPYVQRLREIKDALPGHEVRRYFASYTALAAVPFAALLGACGVSARSIIGPQLVRSIWAGLRPT